MGNLLLRFYRIMYDTMIQIDLLCMIFEVLVLDEFPRQRAFPLSGSILMVDRFDPGLW